jgi:hypothetical protein
MARAEAMRLGLAVTPVAVTVLESTGLGVASHEWHPRIEHAFESRWSIGLWRNVVAEDVQAGYLAGFPFAYTPPARL